MDKKVDCKHIEYLIKDEKEANEEYSEDAKGDPKIDKVALTDEEKAKLGEMANDELRYNGFWKTYINRIVWNRRTKNKLFFILFPFFLSLFSLFG